MRSFHGPYHRGGENSGSGSSSSSTSSGGGTSDASEHMDVPVPRPSECPSKLTYQHLIFARKNFIMDTDVQSEAIVVETARAGQFVSIDVDFQVASSSLVENTDSSKTDVLFIGTGSLITSTTSYEMTLINYKIVYF